MARPLRLTALQITTGVMVSPFLSQPFYYTSNITQF